MGTGPRVEQGIDQDLPAVNEVPLPDQCAIATPKSPSVGRESVFDPGHLGELTRYPVELVDEVLEETRTLQRGAVTLADWVG
jgi:hypothetical protein